MSLCFPDESPTNAAKISVFRCVIARSRRCQPPNSPDLNVLDLGFFIAIQILFEKETPNNINDIVLKVDEAYKNYPVDRANRIFLTQQCCMMEIMRHNGGQHYNIPHMKKKTLELQGCLPITLKCSLHLQNQIKPSSL